MRRGHANLLCIVPILADDLFRGSVCTVYLTSHIPLHCTTQRSYGKKRCSCKKRRETRHVCKPPPHAWMPERSKGADLRSAGLLSAWVRTPLQALCFLFWPNRKPTRRNKKKDCGVSGFRSQYLVLAKDARFRLRQYPGHTTARGVLVPLYNTVTTLYNKNLLPPWGSNPRPQD